MFDNMICCVLFTIRPQQSIDARYLTKVVSLFQIKLQSSHKAIIFRVVSFMSAERVGRGETIGYVMSNTPSSSPFWRVLTLLIRPRRQKSFT